MKKEVKINKINNTPQVGDWYVNLDHDNRLMLIIISGVKPLFNIVVVDTLSGTYSLNPEYESDSLEKLDTLIPNNYKKAINAKIELTIIN